MSASATRPYSTRMDSEVVAVEEEESGYRSVCGGIEILYPGESALFEVEFLGDGEARVTTIIQPTPGIAAALRRAEYRLRHPLLFIRKGTP
jgi:hypothetical protein